MKLKIYSIIAAALFMASCEKPTLDAETPAFDVTAEKTTVKAGEVIKFKISGGETQNISFYSGELLKQFESNTGRVVDVAGQGATLAFSSSVQLGTQANQVSLLASTNFTGDYSSVAKVKAATWVDITSRFKLGTSAAFLASGTVDVSDLIVAGKPIYFAFRYNTKAQATNGIARQWFIQTFTLNSKKLLDNTLTLTIADQASTGFRIVDDLKDKAPALSSVTATRLTLQGNTYLNAGLPQFDPKNPIFDPLNPIYNPKEPAYQPTAVYKPFVPFDPASPYNDPESEHWAVSKGITIDKVDLGPDWSTAIKGLTSPVLSEYRYTYAKAGTYKAVFVASNGNIDQQKKVTKEISITVTP
ncbi:DUF5017 domain-containing protein [Daejeonella sp. H1SJ63]|uniref:DUF5017 domain-containing protein n=1 Tax=Daejeonella sp. H1SJ63 TaxID=3034145 RepID=UPI0023EDBA63|nr:DUF5017 domain-containing protein [Daejeonella sp. H1SJ63]